MRHFRYTQNPHWRPIINVDKLWSLVPTEEKKALTAESDVVPVIDTLRHGYAKVLGNGKLPNLPFIVKTRFVSAIAEYVYISLISFILPMSIPCIYLLKLTLFTGKRLKKLVVSLNSSHNGMIHVFDKTHSETNSPSEAGIRCSFVYAYE